MQRVVLMHVTETAARSPFAVAIAAWLALLSWATPPQADAQDEGRRSNERSRVLSSYSRVVSKHVPFNIGGGLGKVEEVIVSHGEAATLRLHFVVHTARRRPAWRLVVRDGNNRVVWSYTPVAGADADFWSDEFQGGVAKVEVHSTERGSTLRLSIDKVAVSGAVSQPEATTPPDSRAPIQTQSQRIKDLGRAVARLRFIGDDDKGYYCTGVLVAHDLLMTNYHCPRTDNERRSTLVDFDFDFDSAIPKTLRLKNLVIGDRRMDFAIYRLSVVMADRSPLKLDAGNVEDGQALIVIQHPAGQPKQVSILDCRVSDPDAATSVSTDFGHLCDTLGGSSGAPVLDEQTGLMIGLHHLGFNEKSRRPVNAAILLKHIVRYVKRHKRSDVVSALGLPTNRSRRSSLPSTPP